MKETSVRLPKAEEVETVKDKVRKVLAFARIRLGGFRTDERGRMFARAEIPLASRKLVVAGLFGYGIVIVEAENGEWGLAVRG